MSESLTKDAADMTQEEFVEWARALIMRRVSTFRGDFQPPSEKLFISISERTPVYQAATLMQEHEQTWLALHTDGNQAAGFIHREQLADVFGFLETTPYLGEALMELIIPALVTAEE